MKQKAYVLSAVLLALSAVSGRAVSSPEDHFMGDWGTAGTTGIVAEVIALGDGAYEAIVRPAFATRQEPLARLNGTVREDSVMFDGPDSIGLMTKDVFLVKRAGEAGALTMKKVVRRSPTSGKKPPQGAVVLFDGSSTGGWRHRNGQPCGWKIVDGALEVTRGKGGDIISTNVFKDHTLHIEFRTPFQPKARGQGRGNSGVYLQTRYEVQVLDSYGLAGRNNECGGIYGISDPLVNACYPPLEWQTYDIQFRAPRYDESGSKTADAVMTVYHNGILVQDQVSVPGVTTAGVGGDLTSPRGLLLQDHGNPVQYRNIWAVLAE